jgi:polyhydroxyalkanoate synthesis repressor PhaR
MIRLIKRYESRKLYDTEESRYVSLEEIAGWIREGQEVRVVDNASSGDVTSQTLTQIILDEGRRGTSSLPSELLHELVRLGERAVHSGVEQVQHGVDRLVQASIDRLAPVRRAREEMSGLRTRLEQLEASLAALDSELIVGLAEPPASEAAVGGPSAAGNGSAGPAAPTAAPAPLADERAGEHADDGKHAKHEVGR